MKARNRRYFDSVTEQAMKSVSRPCVQREPPNLGEDVRFLLDTANLINPDFDIGHCKSKL